MRRPIVTFMCGCVVSGLLVAENVWGQNYGNSIAAWGNNSAGQCNVPAPNTGFIGISAGVYHSLALKSDGTIVAWGWNFWGQCDVPAPNADFVAIAAGGFHSLGIYHAIYGDMNCDGAVNAFDINGFILAVASYPDFGVYYEEFPNCDPTAADINRDDVVNAYDIDPFIALIAGG